MNNLIDKTIGEIVAEDYRAATVFQQHGIDFCCNGHRNFSEVCSNKSIDPEELVEQIDLAKQEVTGNMPEFKFWPLDLLIDYIEKKHHRYVESKIPVLKEYLQKISHKHGAQHPELLQIARLFDFSAGELTAHMKKEEFILFPHIRKMVKAESSSLPLASPQFGTVVSPIQAMMQEHDNEGRRFYEINQLSNHYLPPEDACNTYQVTYHSLREFENDLHLHIHLENNILFPRAIEMEKALNL